MLANAPRMSMAETAPPAQVAIHRHVLCPACGGSGSIEVVTDDYRGPGSSRWAPCDFCAAAPAGRFEVRVLYRDHAWWALACPEIGGHPCLRGAVMGCAGTERDARRCDLADEWQLDPRDGFDYQLLEAMGVTEEL